MDKIDSTDCTDLGRVVDEADVSLRGGVQLSDFDVTKAIQELRPNFGADPVADGQPHFVVLLVVLLRTVKGGICTCPPSEECLIW